MALLDFPPELFKMVIHDLVAAEGITSVTRLRFVCKAFAAEIHEDILAKQPMSAFTFKDRRQLKYYSVEDRQYMIFAHTQSGFGVHPTYPTRIKMMANFLLRESKGTAKGHLDYVKELCRAVAETTVYIIDPLETGTVYGLRSASAEDPLCEDEMLCAAAAANDEEIFANTLSLYSPTKTPQCILGSPLSIAARSGHTRIVAKMVGYILKAKVDIDHEDVMGAVSDTLRKCHYDTLKALIKLYRTESFPFDSFAEFLDSKAGVRDKKAIAILLDAKVNGARRISEDTFKKVCRIGDGPLVTKLIGKKVVKHKTIYPPYSLKCWPRLQPHSSYPLEIALQAKEPAVITALLDAGAPVDGIEHKRYYTTPALHVAIQYGDASTVRLFLERGARVREDTGQENASDSPLTGVPSDSLVFALKWGGKEIYDIIRDAKMSRTGTIAPRYEEAKKALDAKEEQEMKAYYG